MGPQNRFEGTNFFSCILSSHWFSWVLLVILAVNVWLMSFGQDVEMLKLVLNVKYLSLLSFLTAAEFYNLGHIQGIMRLH